MKLYCANCKEEVTDNIETYENVDGFIVHCGICNEPIMQIPFDEPGWFGNGCEEAVKDTEVKDECCGCSCPDDVKVEGYDPEAEFLERVRFSTKDLDMIRRALNAKIDRLVSTEKSYVDLVDKVETILDLRYSW